MGAVYFYHLTQSSPEATLPVLLGKALKAGWRVTVRAESDGFLSRLDEALWLHPQEGFLPHGRAGGEHDAEQPILLTQGTDLPNGAVCVMTAEGAPI